MRILPAATILSIGTVAFLALAVPRLVTAPSEWEIRQVLQQATPGDTLDEKVREALRTGEIADAEAYRELALELNKPISPEADQALEDALSPIRVAIRNATDFTGAYITGRADSGAGVAGAIISDLTVVGDVRDIISEGGKAAVGEEYSRVLLAIAAVGLAAEGAVIATGGSSLVLKVSLSVLKVAKRTGNITADFGRRLVRLADAAVAPARAADATTTAASGAGRTGAEAIGRIGASPLSRTVARRELRGIVRDVNAVARNAGAADAVKLMRYVRTTDDLSALTRFTQRFGRNSRVVAELTGRTALRAFKYTLRGARILIAFLYSLVAWIIGLVAFKLMRDLAKGCVRVARGAVTSLALP